MSSLTVVDLPDPFGPRKAKIVPLGTCRRDTAHGRHRSKRLGETARINRPQVSLSVVIDMPLPVAAVSPTSISILCGGGFLPTRREV